MQHNGNNMVPSQSPSKAISQMKAGKAPGPSGIVVGLIALHSGEMQHNGNNMVPSQSPSKAISQMKAGKAPGPSGLVVEMIQAASDMGASMIRDLAAIIIRDSKAPSDWTRVSLSASTRERGMHWKGATTQADRAGHESPGENCGWPHQTVGVNRQFQVWLRPRQRQNRRNLCCQAVAREVSSYQQETLHGFHRPGEGV